jgi:alcohol dehydrogenase YqhD (iron-dependent ADH family)
MLILNYIILRIWSSGRANRKLGDLVPKGAKILLAYGGGSIFKNGIHEQVINNLKGRNSGVFRY